MVSIFCISTLFPDHWYTTSSTDEPLVITPSSLALNIPLVLNTIFRHVPYSKLKRMRLVNRIWNEEAVSHLQKLGRQITLQVPFQYNHHTRELVELIDNSLILEDKENIKWPWLYTKYHIDKIPFLKLTFGNVEYILRKISPHLEDLKIGGLLKLQDCPPESCDLIFPNLTDIFFPGCCDIFILDWIIKRSPQLHHLKINEDKSCGDIEGQFAEKYINIEYLNVYVSFLTKLEYSLRTLFIEVTLAEWKDGVPAAIDFVNLTDLQIHTYLAAALFGSPDKLPRVKSLEIVLDETDPQIWLSQWTGDPVLSVERLLLQRRPGEKSKDYVTSQVVHKIGQIFPNTKDLCIKLPLSDYPNSVALDTWLPTFDQFEKLYLEFAGIWQFAAATPDPQTTFAGLKVLTLAYSNGYITDDHCDPVFLQMGKLDRLQLLSKDDRGQRVSHATLTKMQNRFTVTWKHAYSDTLTQRYTRC